MMMMSQLSNSIIAPISGGAQRRRCHAPSASSISPTAVTESSGARVPSTIDPLRIAAEERRASRFAEAPRGVPRPIQHLAVRRRALADVRAPHQPLGADEIGQPRDEPGGVVAGILEPLEVDVGDL